jgi:hypothetical protein
LVALEAEAIMNHIFVHVVRATQDPFSGLKNAILNDGDDRIVDLRFTEVEFDLIDRVEYSERRFFRAFYYPRIFQRLVERLDRAIAEMEDQPANVYFSDEGVWAVFWAAYRKSSGKIGQIRGVNVQHGFALLRPAKFQPVRRIINAISTLVTGFPTMGYGSLGGVGAGAFDLYLTYDTTTARFIQNQLGCNALAAPRLIKHDLIQSFSAIPRVQHDEARILFAMNINMRGSPINCDVGETFDELLDLAILLRDLQARLVLRLHPGMNAHEEAIRFSGHPISKVADLDVHTSLHASMAETDIVMSFVSTVLWESGLLGLLPVQVVCACCDYVDLSYAREELKLDSSLREQLKKLLSRARTTQVSDWCELEATEWLQVKRHLVHPVFAIREGLIDG